MTSADKPIRMTGKEYFDLLQKTRREALEEAATAVCTFCEKGDKPWKWGGELQGFMWYHENPKGELIEPGDTARSAAYCKATNIHKLMIAADQSQGQTTQAGPVEGNEGELGTLEHLIWLDEKIAKAVENIGTEED